MRTDDDLRHLAQACYGCSLSRKACEARRVRSEEPCCLDCRHRDPLIESV